MLSKDLLNWIKHFLVDGDIMCRIGAELSDKTIVLSGVLQSTVLGPLLFCIAHAI